MTRPFRDTARVFSGALIALFVVLSSGCESLVAKRILPIDQVRPAEFGVTIERGRSLTTEDEVKLVADVYRPRGTTRAPTILVRIPFTKTFKNSLGADLIGSFWAKRGYNVVIQGTRGRYKSGGTFYPLRHERADGLATLDWIKQQPWFDGRLGTWGGSAFGQTQWAVADQLDFERTAMNIQIASTDFREMFHPGGAFALESALFWAVRSRGTRDVDPSFDDLERGFNGFPLIDADRRATGEDIPFFDDWANHTEHDSYWHEIDGERRALETKAPALLMAGWYDPFLPTQLRDFSDLRRASARTAAEHSRLIIGPWTHADPVRFPDGFTLGDYRPASIEPSVAWFDTHLMGVERPPRFSAPIRLFVMGANVWRDESEWPLARTRYTSLYLSGGSANSARGTGQLSCTAPIHETVDMFDYDPRNAVPTRGGAMLGPRAGIQRQNDVEQRDDVLVYTSVALDSAVEITGPIHIDLHVATSAMNTDFTAKLVDVHPDGAAFNISDGILRRAYAGGEITPIRIALWPTSMVIPRGHRLRVEISSSNFPHYDRNPNTGSNIATETHPVTARQQVWRSEAYPSRIVLPIIPRPTNNELVNSTEILTCLDHPP